MRALQSLCPPLPSPSLPPSVWLALPLDQDSFFGGTGVEGMGRCEKWIIKELTGVSAAHHHAHFGRHPIHMMDCAANDLTTRQGLPGVGQVSAQMGTQSQRAVHEEMLARQGVCFVCGERGTSRPLKCSGCGRVVYCRCGGGRRNEYSSLEALLNVLGNHVVLCRPGPYRPGSSLSAQGRQYITYCAVTFSNSL